MTLAMASQRELVRLSIRRALCAAAACAALSACAVESDIAGCQNLSSSLSAHHRNVGGQTVICDPNLVDSDRQILHADDYVLQNKMW